MGIVIGAKPDSSFSDPLGLLSDCHRRIEKFLQTLITIASRSQNEILTPDEKHALEVALRYFREAAPRHTLDEEESLFPKLRACESGEANAALAAIDALEADHDKADIGHAEVERLGSQWLAQNYLTHNEVVHLRETLEDLRSLYQKHIKIEDTQIFPLASKVLAPEIVTKVGSEMAKRRGIDWDAISDLKLRCPTRRTESDV